jgi:hypothetical protein
MVKPSCVTFTSVEEGSAVTPPNTTLLNKISKPKIERVFFITVILIYS